MSDFTPVNKTSSEPASGRDTMDSSAIKNEHSSESADEDTVKTPIEAPAVAPKKRGRKKKEDNGDEQESPSKMKKTTKASKEGTPKKMTLPPTPATYEEAGEADRLLLHMKDVENKPWGEINAAWEAITGINVGKSTLGVRYMRLKANFTVWSKDDEEKLVAAKKEIEEKFEVEKWSRIADLIVANGGTKYSTAAIQKKIKDLSKKATSSSDE
ncbi:hypothetical protein ASPZODRAFT_15751 [Penicilliopsis zonata CBS 506.65]|uniref:Myb-like domain-containing protein n=1 Tax=Penicilliopsis zonata CBS 506.65 TaxID=1073090 RepID=A0A1L9SIP8_9EURO|nr:hypothetical protein ASPZODRAFT_15751 [Penicilliopsis zonata CBS 506.65]OJJ47068.1 hypothetical protein ASPZODRAFT_15751 [Penicilliopsis zonata CBS 506.65]